MSRGISNYQIDKFFKEQNDVLQQNYMGTYSIDSITKYINFYSIIKNRNAQYPFAIFNTSTEDEKRGTLVELPRYKAKQYPFFIRLSWIGWL